MVEFPSPCKNNDVFALKNTVTFKRSPPMTILRLPTQQPFNCSLGSLSTARQKSVLLNTETSMPHVRFSQAIVALRLFQKI
jgi:hypothetical protein